MVGSLLCENKEVTGMCLTNGYAALSAYKKTQVSTGAQKNNYILSMYLGRLPDISEVGGNKKGIVYRILRCSC